MDVLSSSFKKANEIQNERIKTEIEIVNVSVTPSNPVSEINVSINNTGSTKILKADYKYIDLFVRYNAFEIGNITKWLPYNDTTTGERGNNEWTVVNITPDFINPRIFDPDEQMKMVIRVEPEIEENSTNWVKVVMPNGVSDAKYFYS
jgi:flagellar protein FlaF